MLADEKKLLSQNLRTLHLPTIRKCYEEQAKLAEQNTIPYPRYLHELVELEVEARRQNRVVRYLRESKLPLEKSWDAFERKRLPRKVDLQLDTLREGSFVERHENVLAFGNPGSGKNASSLRNRARTHPARTSGSVHELRSPGSGATDCQARAAPEPTTHTTVEVPSADHRRHRLRPAGSRRDGSPVYASRRAI